MKFADAVDALWQASQKHTYPVSILDRSFSFTQAYKMQLAILERRQQAGETLAGWKVGLSSPAAREMFKLEGPISAYLLESNHFESGSVFALDKFIRPIIESELCIVMGKSLRGPGITRSQALAAIAGAAPSLELVDMRIDIASNLSLGIADGVAQWGFVTGRVGRPFPPDLVVANITAESRKNGEIVFQVLGQDVIDNQVDTIAWLANHLASYNLALEAGQHILTGSMTKPTPVASGDRWDTTFSSFGTVSASFE